MFILLLPPATASTPSTSSSSAFPGPLRFLLLPAFHQVWTHRFETLAITKVLELTISAENIEALRCRFVGEIYSNLEGSNSRTNLLFGIRMLLEEGLENTMLKFIKVQILGPRLKRGTKKQQEYVTVRL